MCTQYLTVTILLFQLSTCLVQAFNLSPAPNLIYKRPVKQANDMPRSSYFGYSIVLRANSIIIGAPRAQSTGNQAEINEPGAIYKCGLATHAPCSDFRFVTLGNVKSDYYLDFSIRDYQWLGASMDGGPADADRLLVCAPRFVGGYDELKDEDYMHGICYWSKNTFGANPAKGNNVIKLLTDRTRQRILTEHAKSDVETTHYYNLGQQGFSAHITPNEEEFLMGAPGILTWRGSVIRYNTRTKLADIPQITHTDNAYAGYAVSSGYFDSGKPEKILYLVTVPHADWTSNLGEAYIFDFAENEKIKKFATFQGTQYGEFFGYAVLVEDINGDTLDDVLITAPLHGDFDEGAVHVFLNNGALNFKHHVIKSPFTAGSRFGTTITKLGDINLDGYNDIAIGAPFAYGNGAVAVYLGSDSGLEAYPSQTLNLTYNGDSEVLVNSMFGHGLSKGFDIDGNGFNDLAIGAPNAERVFVYRAYPVVKIEATIQPEKTRLGLKDDVLSVKVCLDIINRPVKISQPIGVAARLKLDPKLGRLSHGPQNATEISANFFSEPCRNFTIQITFAAKYVFTPINLELYYELNCADGMARQVFNENCVMVDPRDARVTRTSIGYLHGCKSDICNVDLVIENIYAETVGDIIRLVFKITNKGEKAFNVQANVTSSANMPLSRIPYHCSEQYDTELRLVCAMTNNDPLTESIELEVYFDKSELDELDEVTFTAVVGASGNELTPENNKCVVRQVFPKYAALEILGAPQEKYIELGLLESKINLTYHLAFRNHGPNIVRDLELLLSLPIAYINTLTNNTTQFINTSDIFAVAFLNDKQNDGLVFEVTENVDYIEDAVSLINFTDAQSLPRDQTLVFSCQVPGLMGCALAEFMVRVPFAPRDNLTVVVQYRLSTQVIKDLLHDQLDYLALWFEVGASSNKTEITVEQSLEPCVLVSLKKPIVPLWIYLAAILAGFVVMIALTAVLHKVGFFRRKTREDMEQLIRQQEELSQEGAAAMTS